MAILSKEILVNHGPFIQFADCPQRLHDDECSYPSQSNFSHCVFYEMSDSLLGAYCSVTNTCSPIDPYEFTQLVNPHDIRRLASELLMWAHQLSRAGLRVFTKEVVDHGIYYDTRRVRINRDLNGENLRLDMIETLLMLAGRFVKIAQAERCLVIGGI
jgi:hypothetical protein